MSWVTTARLLGPGTVFAEGAVVSDHYLKARKESPLGRWVAAEKAAGRIVQEKATPKKPEEKSTD